MGVGTPQAAPEPPCDSELGDAQRSLTGHAELARCLLPEFDQVSITVVDSTGSPYTCGWAGDRVRDLDRSQYGLREGPGVDSVRGAVPVVAPHIQRDPRWRTYVSTAAGLGLRSQVAAPLRWRGEGPIGALNMYSTTRGDIAPTAPLIAEALAGQIAGALASFREIENLHHALGGRRTIGIAIGLLMAEHHITESAALTLLRRRASSTDVKFVELAARVVADGNAVGYEPHSPSTD